MNDGPKDCIISLDVQLTFRQTFDLSPTSLGIFAGPKGLKPGDELTFFYPSTEWDMAQGFDCFCGAKTCRGFISGAKNMKKEQLDGLWYVASDL